MQHGLKQPKSHKTPPADAPPQRRLAPRVIAPARARAAVPRLAVARFATESEVVEVRDDGVVVPELVETLGVGAGLAAAAPSVRGVADHRGDRRHRAGRVALGFRARSP